MRALVADDDTVSRLVLGHLLRRHGVEVVEAVDVASALAAVDSAEAEGAPIEALLSDYVMPDGTGIDLVRALAAAGRDLPVVLVTGVVEHVGSSELEHPLVRGVVRKPLSSADVAAALDLLAAGGS